MGGSFAHPAHGDSPAQASAINPAASAARLIRPSVSRGSIVTVTDYPKLAMSLSISD
jgi:hypothetical protein